MCDDCCEQFNIFPAIIVGGPTGDYTIDAPVVSARYCEYRILQIANGDAGSSTVQISGDDKPAAQLSLVGADTLTDNVFRRGLVFRVAAISTISGPNSWQRITHSQKRVFIRIDTAGSNSCYVIIQFRARLLTIIPGPTPSVPAELSHQANIQREKRINNRLEKAGIPERFQ